MQSHNFNFNHFWSKFKAWWEILGFFFTKKPAENFDFDLEKLVKCFFITKSLLQKRLSVGYAKKHLSNGASLLIKQKQNIPCNKPNTKDILSTHLGLKRKMLKWHNMFFLIIFVTII